MNFAVRDHTPELIDLGPAHYTAEEYRDCLGKLGRVGRLLGGDRAGQKAFRSLPDPPSSILDVGCGGGGFTALLAQTFPSACVVGEDLSVEAIRYADSTHREPNLTFRLSPSRRLEQPPGSFDVVTATLVCHHMAEEELVRFIEQARRAARRAVVLNDLHRHPLAYIGFSLVAPVLFPNRLILHDGRLSVRRGFTRTDWHRILEAAGVEPSRYRVRWHWAFRWVVTIETTP